MPIEMRTHGYDWRRVLRQTEIFCSLVTLAWYRDPLAQRQYAYARQLGKPIVLLIQAGTALPAHADDHSWYVWETLEECVDLPARSEAGKLGARPDGAEEERETM